MSDGFRDMAAKIATGSWRHPSNRSMDDLVGLSEAIAAALREVEKGAVERLGPMDVPDEAFVADLEARYGAVIVNTEAFEMRAALNAAPRPTSKLDADWMVQYTDWFFQTRGRAIKECP